MNNYEGAYFEYYRDIGLDYAVYYHTKKCENFFLHPYHLRSHYRYDGKTLTGKGITIGIVVPFGYGGIKNDFELFCDKFSLPKAKIEVYYPKRTVGAERRHKKRWSLECALDLQWSHIFSPEAVKKCFFAASDDMNDIFETLRFAEKECDIIVISFGKTEFAGLSEYEDFFKNSKAVYVCASGNNSRVNYPASSQYTVAVGGTCIYFYPDGETVGNEVVYQKSGCGLSRYTKIPKHQADSSSVRTESAYRRSVPDMCFFADGNKVCPVCFEGQLESCSGTSIGAPCVAGLCACIAQSDREILAKKASYFYELAEKCHIYRRPPVFFDITSGKSGKYCAKTGFDICTGLGSPNFEEIFRAIRMPV